MGQRLTAPGRGYREKGLRGSERTGRGEWWRLEPRPAQRQMEGKPRKTPRLKEEIGRGGGAAKVRPLGTQALEAKETGGPASARW